MNHSSLSVIAFISAIIFSSWSVNSGRLPAQRGQPVPVFQRLYDPYARASAFRALGSKGSFLGWWLTGSPNPGKDVGNT